MEDYKVIEETKYLNNENDIIKYFFNLEDERKKGLSSVKFLNYNETTNFFTVLVNYKGDENPIKRTIKVEQKVKKYQKDDGSFLSTKEYNILRRRNWKKFNIPEDDKMGQNAPEDVQLILEDRELEDILGLYPEVYDLDFAVERKIKKLSNLKEVQVMPSFMCAKFGDKTQATVNNSSSGFGGNMENAFVLPSLVGVTGSFGGGNVFSVRLDNVDETLTQNDFKDYMRDFGITNCKDMRLIMKKKKNRDGSFETLDENKGFGFIEFFSLVNAEEAVELLDRQRIGLQLISASIVPNKDDN